MPSCDTCNSNTDCINCLTGYIKTNNLDPVPDTCICDPSTVVSGNCV